LIVTLAIVGVMTVVFFGIRKINRSSKIVVRYFYIVEILPDAKRIQGLPQDAVAPFHEELSEIQNSSEQMPKYIDMKDWATADFYSLNIINRIEVLKHRIKIRL
jgi:hypothetical protein